MIPNNARRLLINIGKVLPFTLCFVLLIHYAEVIIAVISNSYTIYNETVVVYTPISFKIAKVFKYNALIVSLTLIISLAIEACKWNLYSCIYLAVNLIERNYLVFEVTLETILIISVLNILISAFLVYKGCCIFVKKC